MKTIFEEKVAEGEERERSKNQVEIRIETILLILVDRFNGVTKKLEKKIQKIADVEQLNQLIKLAAKCKNTKEFEKALD